jgi:hypothetical protein
MLSNQRIVPCAVLVIALTLSSQNGLPAHAKKPIDPVKDGWLYHNEAETHHIRLKIDKASKEVRALVLDSGARKILPVRAKAIELHLLKAKPAVKIVLQAKPQKNDGAGTSSLFVGKSDGLPKDFDKRNIELLAEIDDKQYRFRLDPDEDGK